MYIIIKHVKIRESMKLPVIMLEYNNKDKAQEMVNILNTNSDSGHK